MNRFESKSVPDNFFHFQNETFAERLCHVASRFFQKWQSRTDVATSLLRMVYVAYLKATLPRCHFATGEASTIFHKPFTQKVLW